MNPENRKIFIFSDIRQISDFVIDKWLKIADNAIKDKGHFTIALSGGKTPVILYNNLADLKKPAPWDKTHLFLVDERFVPSNDKDSNFNMMNQTFLGRLKIPATNIHPIQTETDSPQTSALRYEQDLKSFFMAEQNEFPEFDLILLGIGEDGHTASLFPGTPSITETKHLSVAVHMSDTSKKDRITLTFPVINNARHVFFLISGADKAGIVKEVIETENSSLPASMVRPKNGKLFFLLAENAGSLLTRVKI